MCPLLLILAIFVHSQVRAEVPGVYSVQPASSQYCEKDAFISSQPINGKVFLYPWKLAEREANWYEARGYCAANCAEIVTINSVEEHQQLNAFIKYINNNAKVWGGAQILNKAKFTAWSNGNTNVSYQPMKSYAYADLSCLELRDINAFFFYNLPCENKRSVVCQRPETWTTCE